MPSAGRILLLSALSRAVLVHTAPTLSFPINSQVPPVARIGELFSFVFSDSTFTASDGSSLSYSLIDPPSWLALDSSSRTLSGTPQDADIAAGTVVGVNITLMATDSLGGTADDATLVVSRNPAPSVQIPIADQIQTFGNYSEPSSILCSPEEDFKFIFASDTFSDTDAAVLSYYSVMIDNSPLPAWLSFDAGALTFAGTTPPFSSLIQPPQTFSVKLIASDVTGFSGTSLNFSIVVGSHTLTTSQPEVTLNATAGEPLVYDGLVGSIEIDGQIAQPSQVNVTTEDLPSWLSFDAASWQISGTPPDTAQSTTFTIVMQDTYADLLNITISLQLVNSDSLFQSTFPALTVKPGSSFSFDLSSYLLDPADLDVTTSIQPATSWISWNANSLTLTGDAPTSAQKSVVNVTFTVVANGSTKIKRAGESQSQELVIQIDPAAESTSSSAIGTSTSSPSSSTTTAASSTATTTAAGDTYSQSHSIKWTVVAIVISVIAVLAIIASVCFCYCSRRKKKRLSRSSSDPYPDSTFIHTPGHAVGSPELQNNNSANEKEKNKKAITVWKASSLRRGVEPPPSAPAGFGFGAFYNDDQPSVISTPRGKIHDWFASMKSLRVVHVLPSNRRTSTDSSLPDEGRSHHGMDLESAGPPFITLNQGSQSSFRDALEVSLPTQDSSLQLTPDAVYSADRRRASRRISKGKNPQTPGSDGKQKQDPFTDIHVVDSISPISEHNPDPDHSKAQHISPVTPTEPGPSFPLPSSSTLPPTRPLRPANSQKSFASSASSSIDSLRGHSQKFARKASAHAKGAIFALQSPKRRTYAALGKRRSAGKRKRRNPVLEDDESAMTGGARSLSSPATSSLKPGSRSGGGGIAGFLSPRVWPQPGGRNFTVPQTDAEAAGALGDTNERPSIRRRPVPSRRDTEQSGSGYSATDSIVMPSPLRTPVRSGHSKNYSKVSPYGLGILDVCNEIADSSPYGPSPNSMGTSSASAERNWELIVESPISKNREEVGRALGGEEMDSPAGANKRKSVAGVSEQSKASSGVAAYV
ncbi:polarity establishment/cellular polarization [Gnomoniopsis sp. IMI 355080]|nr:polarity establishment/cellular polarization [Gnomoniopsis sp. IMI 355080]